MSASNARAEERVNAHMRVRVRGDGPYTEMQLVDLSARGMLLASANPPDRGEIVEVQTNNGVLVGQVRWSRGNRFGVRLGDRIDVDAFTGRAPPPRPSASLATQDAQLPAEEEAGTVYNMVFFAAASIASLGFLLTAAHKWMG